MKSNASSVARSLMLLIDSRQPTKGLTTSWACDRYLEIMSSLIGEIEIAMNAVKDTTK